jgi:hypothetical protein
MITLLCGFALLVCLDTAPARDDVRAPRLHADTDIATAGFYRLSWEAGAGRVELQEAESPGFAHPATRYLGHDRATVISGRPDGVWYYRLRSRDDARAGPWSETVRVTVQHHPLSRALLFFGLGIAVFLATLLMILRGTGQAR